MYSWKIKVFKSLDIVYFPTDLSAVKVFAYISSNYWLRFKKLRRWIQPLRCFRKSFFSAGNFACNLSLPLPRGRTAVGILEIRETKRGGGREKLWRDHEIFIPLKSLSVVTINNHESRNNVPPGSTTASFLSFFLSLRLSSNFPSLSLSLVPSSMSRCHGDATSFNCETFPPQYEAMNQRGSRSLFPFNYKIFAISLRFDNVAIISMFSFSRRAAFESFQISFRGEKGEKKRKEK